MLVPVKVMENIHKVCDSQSTRYALGGAYFSRDKAGEASAVATDSRRLLVVQWDEPDDTERSLFKHTGSVEKKPEFSAIIPKSSCAEAARLVHRKDAKLHENYGYVLIDEQNANGRVPVGVVDTNASKTIATQPIEGRFPRYQDVLNDCEKNATACIVLDPAYLLELLKIMQTLVSTSENKGVTLYLNPSNPDESPIVMKGTGNGIKATAVLMPLSSDEASEWNKARREGAAPKVEAKKTRKRAVAKR